MDLDMDSICGTFPRGVLAGILFFISLWHGLLVLAACSSHQNLALDGDINLETGGEEEPMTHKQYDAA